MKAIGWQGGSILALETLKRVVVAGNRARDALVAQGLKLVATYTTAKVLYFSFSQYTLWFALCLSFQNGKEQVRKNN